MQRNTKKIILAMLLTLAGVPHLSAQSWLLLTVKGSGGDFGYIAASFSDAAGNNYSEGYSYGPTDTPASVASALVTMFTNGYGYLGLNTGSTGATLGIQLPPNIVRQTNNDGFTAPSVPGQGSSTSAPTADPGVSVTQSSDGSITISAAGSTPNSADPSGATSWDSTVMAVETASGVEYITVPDPSTSLSTTPPPSVFNNPSDPNNYVPIDEESPNPDQPDTGYTTVAQAMEPVTIVATSNPQTSVVGNLVTYSTTVYYSDGTAVNFWTSYYINGPC